MNSLRQSTNRRWQLMLIEFQQAFADLVASPELCISVRSDPGVLRERYQLSDLEWRQLVGIVNDPGMECNCMLYRANRLAPLALNLPELVKALGDDLRPTLDQYWSAYSNTDVHFLVESHRFCEFVRDLLGSGHIFQNDIHDALEREAAALALRLEASYTERYRDYTNQTDSPALARSQEQTTG